MKIMRIIFALISSVVSTVAFADNSSWQLCANKAIVISMVKYSDNLGQQVTDLNLLVGISTSKGKLEGNNSGNVILNNPNGEPGFQGVVKIDMLSKTVGLKGDLFIPGTVFEIDQILTCTELNANSL